MSQTGEALSRLRKALVAAQTEFVQGNAKPFKSLWSHGEDVSIFGAFGGFEQGWSLVGARLDWASSQFGDGLWSCEDVAAYITDDMACLVGIERTEALLGDGQERVVQELRVTHVFRREGDAFRIVHRHADPLRPTQRPGK
jgi:ketosteroid isomerase-like protein